MSKVLIGLVLVVLLVVGALWFVGKGYLGEDWGPGEPNGVRVPAAVVAARARAQADAAAAAGSPAAKQILFGDLHVHSTYSTDAFIMSLPMSGGDGARPVSDACDFARYCSELDFWSINDHALALTPRRWRETVEAMRQCDEVSGDPASPDVVPFLGWEWTQVGTTPQNHYGHKNVVLHHLDDARIPTRPISAGLPRGADRASMPPTLGMGLLGILSARQGGIDLVHYMREQMAVTPCAEGVPERDLPTDCMEVAPTPDVLFAKLDDWGLDSLVIPHGTTWGYYTPAGSSWDKQLTAAMHDPDRQKLIEVYSGHGNSEEFRAWREVEIAADGSLTCPQPTDDYLPSCWRAGEIIRKRCTDAGESAADCEKRAAEARANYLAAGNSGHLTVPGAQARDWGDSGQCRNCFLPAFNYRPRSSVQYILALGRGGDGAHPMRFRFGFIASSDNHSARPGTGYKEFDRRDMTEARFANFTDLAIFRPPRSEPEPRSVPFDPGAHRTAFFGLLETERQGSFFLTGGLVAAHAQGRTRDAIWDAFQRREVYGTSGPRILLWFDLLNPPGTRGGTLPMGSETRMAADPIFQVRAVGSFAQLPGCPDYATGAVSAEGLDRLCRGECYHPSNERRRITRIEVVRIRPQARPDEDVEALVEDPWRSFACEPDPDGCRVTFSDSGFAASGRDTLYYARAIEEQSDAVDHDGVACLGTPLDEDCLGPVEERAWSSPIYVDHARNAR